MSISSTTEHLAIDAAEARYSFRSAPTLLVLPGRDRSVAAIFDGTGSWGTGQEAAAWAHDRFDARWRHALERLTVDEIERDLLGLGAHLPPEIREEEFGWSFSAVVLLTRARTVSVLALGHLSALWVTSDERQMLYRPRLLREELAAAHDLSAGEMTRYEHLVVSPFLGDHNANSLERRGASLSPGEALVASHWRLVDAIAEPPANAASVQAGPAREYGPSAAIVIRGR